MRLSISHDQQLAVLDGSVLVKAGVPVRPSDYARIGPCFGCALSPDSQGLICDIYDFGATDTRCGRSSRKDGRTIVWEKV